MTHLDENLEPEDTQLVEKAERGLAGQGSVVEMMRRLKEAVRDLERTTTCQQRKMICLTWSIVVLTVVTVALMVVEIARLSHGAA